MSTETLESLPVGKCRITEVFDQSFIRLLELAPANELVRGLILKRTGRLPDQQLVTFAGLKEWIEANCANLPKPPPPPPAGSRARTVTRTLDIRVNFEETEHGRCSYSVNRYAEDTYQIDDGELLELVREAIDNEETLDELTDTIMAQVEENAWDVCEPDLDYGDYDHDDHEAENWQDREIAVSRTQLAERLRAYLHSHHPALLEQL